MNESGPGLEKAIVTAIDDGNWQQGVQLAERLCREQPQNGAAWVWRATCLKNLGRIAEALGCARTAASLGDSSNELGGLITELETSLTATNVAQPTAYDSDGLPPTLREEDFPDEEAQSREATKTFGPESESVQWEEGDLIDGRFAVKGVMRGGMGEVYFVLDRELGLDIAVKTPLPSALATDSGRARFMREAEAWIGLGLHPNICSAYYVRSIAGIPRLFIEYVDGGSLSRWLKANRTADAIERLDVAIQIASGMRHAHTFAWRDEEGVDHRGIVHRDLKPANVLMTTQGVPRVTDFGLVGKGDESESAEEMDLELPAQEMVDEGDSGTASRSLATSESIASGGAWETVTAGGMAMGTPPYMPPEQWDGAHRAGFPADVYAFGCVLYELFCGRRLFLIKPELRKARGDVLRFEWERLHREVEPENPRAIVDDLDPELAMLISDCVRKDPENRPSGFEEIGERLREIYRRVGGKPYPRPDAKPSRLLANTLNNRGVSFVTLDQKQRAGRAFAQALRSDPTHFRARYNHALFSWRYGGMSETDVVEQLDEAARSGVYDWRDELLAGRLEQTIGFLDRGAGRCEQARKNAEGEPQAERVAAVALCGLLAGEVEEEKVRQIRDRLRDVAAKEPHDGQVQLAFAVTADRLVPGCDESLRALAQARASRPDLPSDMAAAAALVVPGQCVRNRTSERAGRIDAVALDRAGSTLVVAAEGGSLAVHTLDGDRQVKRSKIAQRRVAALALVDQGKSLLVASEGEPVIMPRLEDGVPQRRFQLHSGHLNALAVSEDAGLVVAVGSDGAVTTWKLETGEREWAKRLHEGFVAALALTSDGNLGVSGGRDGIGRVFLPATGDVARELPGHKGGITAVGIEPAGRWILTAAGDQKLRLWSRAGECERVLSGHADRITFLSIASGGKTAVSGSVDGVIRHWDLEAGEPLMSVRLDAAILSGAASEDLSVVVAGHPAGTTTLAMSGKPELRPGWAVASLVTVGEAEQRAESFLEHMDRAREFLADGEHQPAWIEVERAREITGYERVEEAVNLSGEIARPFPRAKLKSAWEENTLDLHQGGITAVALAGEDDRCLTAGSDHRLVLADLASDAQVRELVSDGEVNASLSFSPDGRVAAGGALDNLVRVWDLQSYRRILSFRGHDGQPGCLQWHPAGDLLLSASVDGTIRLWDVRGGGLGVLKGHLGAVTALTLSPDGRFAASGGDDGSVVLWNLEEKSSVRELASQGSAIVELAWDEDGRHILVVSKDGSAQLMDAIGDRVARKLVIEGKRPLTADLSADGRRSLIGLADGSILLHDLRSRELVRRFSGPSSGLVSVRFSWDDRRVVGIGSDGVLRVWRLDWQPEFRAFADWDERARPILEACAAVHQARERRPRAMGVEERPLVDQIAAKLSVRGLGWIRRRGIEEALGKRESEGDRKAETQLLTMRTQRKTMLANPLKRRNLFRRLRIAAIVLVILSPAFWWVGHKASLRQVRFDRDQVRNVRMMRVQSAGSALRDPLADREQCRSDLFDHYLGLYTRRHGRPDQIAQARVCLEVLADPRVVEPSLGLLRIAEQGSSDGGTRAADQSSIFVDDVISLLVSIGDVGTFELERSLRDRDPMLSLVSARVLALRSSEAAIATLLLHAHDPSADVRLAVSTRLREIVASGHLTRDESIELLESLAMDESAQVRRNVVRSLRMLSGSRPRELAQRMTLDADPGVVRSARYLLDEGYPLR